MRLRTGRLILSATYIKISEQALEELKVLLAEDYPNEVFSEKRLEEIAENLLRTVKVIYDPLPEVK